MVNLSTSAMVESLGREVHRTPVGEINVTRRMLELSAPVGGEGNGGLIVPECHPGRDGMLAAAVILHRMARTGRNLSELAGEFPKLFMVKDKVRTDADPMAIEDKLAAEFNPVKTDRSDGLRFTISEGWLHIRASNTEPVVRVIAESKSPDVAEKLVKRARRLIVE